MRRAWLVGLLALAPMLGCRVQALEGAEYVGPKNRCENAATCPTGASCSGGTCVAEQTSYPLVIEATPPASANFAPGVTFSVAVDDRRGGTRDLELPETAEVVARLAADVALPLVLRLERVGAVPGTPAASFEAKASNASEVTPKLVIPPGDYQVFVGPANDDDLTRYPPVQLRTDTLEPLVVTFPAGSHELRIAYGSGFRTIDVAMFGPDGKTPLTDPREARDIRVIDETTGRLASTIAHTCEMPGKPLRTAVSLSLAPEIAGHRYTLRVEPAASSCSAATALQRATIDFDFGALDVEGRGNKVAVTVPAPTTVLVSGLITAYGKSTIRIDGDIVLRSVKLDGSVDSKSGHAFSIVRSKIIDGTLREAVLPGVYRADITPSADLTRPSYPYAVCVDCTVPSQDPMAKPGTRTAEFRIENSTLLTFEVPQRVQVSGGAAGFDNLLFTLGTWEASSSTSLASFSFSGARLATRAQTGVVSLLKNAKTDKTWNVGGALDPGTYDLVVRSPEASDYPWIVRPRLEVPPQRELDLGTMVASAPVVLTGVVKDPSGAPVPRATIRARALITASDPKKPALGAVLVGETRADDAGVYRLVVPSVLTTPKKEPTTP